MKTRYKFLRLVDDKVKSNSGDCTWKLNAWKHEDKVSLCNYGFHCSKEIWQAFSYVQGGILAEVEVKGKKVADDNKEAYTDMRIVRAWKWQKKDSVALSIFSAELCLEEFEKVFPDDKRPREAIEAAKEWLLEPTKANESAAESASESAWSAARSAAESAAESASESAWSAARSAAESAWSAWSAAESAAESAWSAAESAWSAAESAKKKVFTAICKWFDNHLTELETYE